jgi:hypothetical protein
MYRRTHCCRTLGSDSLRVKLQRGDGNSDAHDRAHGHADHSTHANDGTYGYIGGDRRGNHHDGLRAV